MALCLFTVPHFTLLAGSAVLRASGTENSLVYGKGTEYKEQPHQRVILTVQLHVYLKMKCLIYNKIH